nr:CHASE2 domain-containing protein [Actinomycetota bacterium]
MRQARRRRLRTLLLVSVALGAVAVALGSSALNLLRQPELDTVDARFAIRGVERPPPDLAMVLIDDVTFAELDEQWPFPRSMHGEVMRRLKKAGVKVIAFDVAFAEESEVDEDNAFFRAVRAAGNVVLSVEEVDDRGRPNLIGGEEFLSYADARAGNTRTVRPDSDGIVRRMTHANQGLEGFGVAAAERSTGRQIPASAVGGDTTYIDYHGPPGTIPSASYSRVLEGKVRPGFFRGKTVVIGASATSLHDVHNVSTGENMPGPELQANAISTARRGFPLKDAPGALNVALIVLLGLIAPVASLRLRLWGALVLALATGGLFAVATQLAFNGGLVLSFLYPMLALVLGLVGALAVYYVTEAFEREQTRDLFARFVPESVVEEVMENADGLRLGGVQREGTVMFSDLRGFTSYSESLEPAEVIEVLNRYLTEMSDAILNHGGTLVAYMGDGIMAVFGAPLEQEDHADRALAAAREMLDRLERFNEGVKAEGLGQGFRMGIGLNSGPVMSGHVGSEQRLEYTALGDVTNTAARLEGMTKGTPHQLFVAESTRAALTRDVPELFYVGEFEVRGREAKIRLWSLPEATDPEAMV